MLVAAALKRNDQVERTASHLARASRNHVGMKLIFRNSYSSLMRMRREILNYS
jgi:hypothetical protein